MKILSLEKIGEAVNPRVTRQAVFKWVAEGKLVRNSAGKIDVENRENAEFLREMGFNLSKKLVKEDNKQVKKPKEKTVNQWDKEDHSDSQEMSTSAKLREEKLKSQVLDNKRKEFELLELKNRFFNRETIESVAIEIGNRVVATAVDTATSISEEILSLRVTRPDDEREALIELLKTRYVAEFRNILEDSKKKIKNLKNKETVKE